MDEHMPCTGDVLPEGGVLADCVARTADWQIWSTQDGSALLASCELVRFWADQGFVEPGLFLAGPGGFEACEAKNYGFVSSLKLGPYPQSGLQVASMAKAMAYARKMLGAVRLSDALYLPQLPYVLPVGEADDRANDALTLGRWASGGMDVPFTDGERMRTWVPGLGEVLYAELLALFGWTETASQKVSVADGEQESAAGLVTKRVAPKHDDPFSMPGQAQLECFFRERIIDVVEREEEYQRMGISFPGPTLLVGPPGCGKTYAVERLVEYLGWPSYSVNAESVGSSYIHETSKRIAQLFSQAADDAPSVVIIDEMDAFLSDRGASGSHLYHVEEMAEFLRAIPELPKKRVLLFGMTNAPERIDKAILRKGRFDHVIEVDYPSDKELVRLLDSKLSGIPTERDLDLAHIARRLKDRPISDAVYVVKEAGRLAVVEKRDRIGTDLLERACDDLEHQGGRASRSAIGFM